MGPDKNIGEEVGRGKGKRPSTFVNAKDRKKARQQIAVQGEARAVPSGEGGPSVKPTGNDAGAKEKDVHEASTMLRSISVVEFAEARAFEITAMEKALENATEHSGVARVFQTVPRHMRRRAASHNVKRLPKRLHARAQAQLDSDPNFGKVKFGTQKKTKPKKKRPASAQRAHGGSRLLETHLWNAKRMKIMDVWGWKLPQHPNDKNFRSAFRAAKNESLVNDVSYFEVVEMTGTVEALNALLLTITDPTLPAIASKRYVKGTRQGSTLIHGFMQYPAGAIGPATFLWKPTEGDVSERRTLWMWLHPAFRRLVIDLLKRVHIETFQMEEIEINDLREELVRFEITGPRSNAILHHIMHLSEHCVGPSQPTSAGHKLWEKIADFHTPASLPPGVAVGLSIVDPRISFAPKMPPRAMPSSDGQHIAEALLAAWPDDVARTEIWDSSIRQSCMDTKPTEGALNKRRSECLVPGTPLGTTPEDVRVPILLLQRNCMAHVTDVSTRKGSREYVAGWDLVAPKGWGKALLRSLVFAGARIGGLRERHMFHYEAGVPCFPDDYPETTSHEALAAKEGALAEEKWKRLPPAKRPNYEKRGILHPFISPFEKLGGAQAREETVDAMDVVPVGSVDAMDGIEGETIDAMEGVVMAQTIADAGATDSASTDPVSKALDSAIPTHINRNVFVISSPRLITYLRTSLVASPVSSLSEEFLKHWKILTEARFPSSHLPNLTLELVSSLLVRVRINMLRKGSPGDRAYVYAATQEEYEFWNASISKKDKDWNVDEDRNLLDVAPSPNALLGFVTTGRFSVARGHGTSIACCKLGSLHRVVQNSIGLNRRHTHFVLVRDTSGRVCLPATFELIT
ncbi:NUC188 domain-containing protein [Powellomyces hirtus]|nr:NUC188 domain-containing protein [Powellomyces hirtus]